MMTSLRGNALAAATPTATPTPGVLTAVPTLLNFGGAVVGSNTSQDLTLSNSTAKTLAVLKVLVSSGDYSFVSHCTAGLAPGKSCAVTVTFHPTIVGNDFAGLVVFSTDGIAADGFGQVKMRLAGFGINGGPSPTPGATVTPTATLTATATATPTATPTPTQTASFSHIIVIFQENRTPDNLFGSNPTFEPGVDIATSGVNSTGKTVALTPVALNACYDLGHHHGDFVAQFHNGKMDGADKVSAGSNIEGCVIPPNPQFKFVDNATGVVQPYFDLATQYSFANRMFQTNQGPSFPAHQFILSGTSAPDTYSPLFASENGLPFGSNAGCLSGPTATVTY
jgi:hypothetical protein